jgi:3-phenylpropionate/trans-cinnamate dioxygenase ferredoxin reductase subunit
MTDKIVIVGAGHAAGQVVATLRLKKFDGSICLIGEEAYLPYQRPPLSKKYLAGELPAERLHFKADNFYDEPNIEVHLNTTIDRIDRETKVVRSIDGLEFPYDKLVISLGAHARLLGRAAGSSLSAQVISAWKSPPLPRSLVSMSLSWRCWTGS